MNRNLIATLLLLPALLQACASESSKAKRDTADFFTKLSQGYRMHVKSQPRMDAMWVSVEMEKFQNASILVLAKSIARLTGDIMQRKGVMDGRLFLLFQIQDGEIQGPVKLCQPVENPLADKGDVRHLSRQAGRIVRTTHSGDPAKLGTAFRALQAFAMEEGLELSGWGSIRVIRGALDETISSRFLTEAQLYIK